MTDRELMQQALDALEHLDRWLERRGYVGLMPIEKSLRDALRARLAQPEPEPINYEDWKFNPMTGEPLWDKQPEPEPEELGEIVPADEEQLKRIEKLLESEPVAGCGEAGCDEKRCGTASCLRINSPRKEWQGLTAEEIEDACWTEVDQRLRSFARAIEAKLKEKNSAPD